jgi:hypothetical protein
MVWAIKDNLDNADCPMPITVPLMNLLVALGIFRLLIV